MGGECRLVDAPEGAFDPEGAASLQWSPDDRWLLAIPGTGGAPYLLDPNGGPWTQLDWRGEGNMSWQRLLLP
jgi:hypothetical protein